ncbi:phosphate starvation-inducible protein PsiF [Bradyrhizobium sp. WSM 1704]|uniref:PsiF family protein n=1 Tax=Bradyrhizobium semiaridum TaxID=2821404 RepID=UPI001CE358FB|nr:PsiF family protein [Bradyrhizobium semiaridum]MCA6124397.1 phosphate starvation-inducible protein PsiF [Bradyrhizobium semiaridum]
MTKISSLATATALASVLLMGGAFAQTTAPAAKDAAPKTETTKADTKAPAEKKQRSAESLECSKEADAKGLHGKERKKFRSECKKQKAAGGAAAQPASK